VSQQPNDDMQPKCCCTMRSLLICLLVISFISIVITLYLLEQHSIAAKQTGQSWTHLQDMYSSPNTSSWTLILNEFSKLSLPGNQVAPVILKMSNFTKKIKDKEKWHSSPFYTFHNGYRFYIRVNAAGDDDEGSHISVYLYHIKGAYDDELYQVLRDHGPLTGTFTIELLNQLSDTTHYARKVHVRANDGVNNDYMVWGDPQFLAYKVILSDNNTVYLKNESLFFRIDFEYEYHYTFYSHLLRHLLWTLLGDVYILGCITLAMICDKPGYYQFHGLFEFLCWITVLFTIFYAYFVVIGSLVGGILWLILTPLATYCFLTILDATVARLFDRHTSIFIYIHAFMNNYQGMTISLMLNSFLARIIIVDLFSMPYTLWGVI